LIWELQDGLCFYCGGDTNSRAEHVDHFVPLIRGGSNARFNIVVSCQTCNCKKGGKLPLEFMGFLKFKLPPLWEEQY
jgi:5-methylcytosine-specific restriction endonuclease McrA